jgi:pimeloyl-ACP methyl ester carboxylesterase
MSDLIITIAGSSGGKKGPHGIYDLFQSLWKDKAVEVLQIDTIPESIAENVEQVAKIALEQSQLHKNVYIVGYSMGATVAAVVAQRLNSEGENRIKGIALLAPQTDGLWILGEIPVPVLFYHGSNDHAFRTDEIQNVYRRCAGPAKMVEVTGLTHDLTYAGSPFASGRYLRDLANDIIGEISSLSSLTREEEPLARREIITKEIPLSRRDRAVNNAFSSFLKMFG